MRRTWQDFDENCLPMWGKWFGSLSEKGWVHRIVGPYETEQEVLAELEYTDPEEN